MLRTFHVAQVWQKVSVFGSSCVMSLLSLPHSPSSHPDFFVLTTSTYFSTFSVLHVRSTEPVSIHKRTRSLEGVWPTGRLVSTHKNDERSSSTRKLVANTQIIITCRRYSKFLQKKWRRSPIDATFSVESYKGQRIDVRECYVDESCLALWEGFREEFRNPPEYEIREYRECVWYYSKNWYRNSLKKFWMWNAWDIHHHHERDQCWQMIRRSSGRRQEYLSTLILFYVLVRRNKVQEQQKSGKANLKMCSHMRCIHHIKMQWESMEKQLNSSGKKFQDFSRLSILQEIQKDLIQKNIQPKEPNHLRVNVQRHPVEIRWSELHLKRWESQRLREAVPSRTLDVSWSRLRDDMVRRFSRTTVGSHTEWQDGQWHPIFTDISA